MVWGVYIKKRFVKKKMYAGETKEMAFMVVITSERLQPKAKHCSVYLMQTGVQMAPL